MNEQRTMEETVVADVMATPAKKLAEEAPEIAKPEPRKCGKCDAKGGNGAGKIAAEVFFNERTRRYDWRALCQICGRKSGRPLVAIEVIESMVASLNAERDAQLAAAKAAREADGKKFDAAIAVFRAIAAGRIRRGFVARMNNKGEMLCGNANCSYCGGKDLAKVFAVMEEVVGLCIHQGAALREAKLPWLDLPWGDRAKCDAEIRRLKEREAAFHRAVGYFQDLWRGEEADRPQPLLDEKGRLLCGVPGCGEKKPVDDGLVSELYLEEAGLCRFHRAAAGVANSRGTHFFVAPLAECDRFVKMLRERIRSAAWASRDHVPSAKPAKPAEPKKAAVQPPVPPKPVPVVAGVSEDDLAQAVTRGRVSLQEAAAAGDPDAIFVLRHDQKSHATCAAKSKNSGKKGGKKDGDKGGKPGKGRK